MTFRTKLFGDALAASRSRPFPMAALCLCGLLFALAGQPAAATQTWTTDLVAAPVATPAQATTGPAAAPAAEPAAGPSTEIALAVAAHPDETPEILAGGFRPAAGALDVARDHDEAALVAQGRQLAASPPRSMEGQSALGCLAVAIYHEARNQPIAGQQAVASVILRRAAVPHRWGSTVCSVIQPVQFSFMRSRTSFPRITEMGPWRTSIAVAIRTLVDGPLPEFADADHYHATHVAPAWRHKMHRLGRVGDHVFYRDPDSFAGR